MITLPGKSIFSPPKPAAIAPLPPVVQRGDASVKAAGAKTAAELAKRKGRKSTIVTGAQGVTAKAPLAQPRAGGKQVLGG